MKLKYLSCCFFFLNLNSISVHTETFVKMVNRREQTLIVQA